MDLILTGLQDTRDKKRETRKRQQYFLRFVSNILHCIPLSVTSDEGRERRDEKIVHRHSHEVAVVPHPSLTTSCFLLQASSLTNTCLSL